jgi:hypothetical protein
LNLVGCKGLVVVDRFKTSDYVGMLKQLMPDWFETTKEHTKQTKRKAQKVPSLEFLIMVEKDDVPDGKKKQNKIMNKHFLHERTHKQTALFAFFDILCSF